MRFILLSIILLLSNLSISQTTVNFNYTGSAQNWTVPPCVTSITVVARGAKGGGNNGGNGAIVTATLAVTPGQVLQINVGGMGTCGNNSQGWNGGGTGRAANTSANGSCGGGGATDIRVTPYGLGNRMMVAAGGGGMGGGTQDAIGGAGGCPNGQAGTSPFGQGGGGATTTAGGNGGPPWITSGNAGTAGSLGLGGNGATDPCYNNSPGGGGGGGLFGGGGGGSDCFSSSPYGGGSGGGGSSLVPAGATCTTGASGNATNGSLTITYTVGSGTATPTNTGPYCVGQTIQLNSTAATTYSWTGPNGFSSTLQNPTLPNASAANAGVYSLTTVQNGCTSTGTTAVVVNPLPNVNAGPDVSVCQNGSVTLTASGAISYSWSPGGQTTASISVSPAITTTYTVTGTTSGCVNTGQVVVTVNPIPTVNAGPDVSICTNGNTTLTASGATTYSWAPGGQTTASITVAPVTTTTYTVTGTALGCTNSDQVVVTVLATAPINAGPDVTICQGTSTILSASGGVTYTWNNGVGLGNGITVNPNVTTTYTVSGTDANGCIGSDDVLITVNILPNVSAGADQTVCDGALVTLTGSGALNYSWSNGVSNGVAFSQPVGNTTYTLTGTDANGCVNTDDVVVVANPLPAVNAGPDVSICANGNTTLTASGGTTYSWAPGGQTTASISVAPVTTATYTVTGTALGCTNSDQVVVTVLATAPINAGPDVTICQGTSTILSASGGVTYTWNNGVGLGNGITVNPNVTITYTVSGTDANGCIGSDDVLVTVNILPNVSAGADQTVCDGIPVTLTGSGALNYSWSNGVSNGVVFSQPVGNTTYTLTGTDANGCVNTDNVQVAVVANPIPVITGPTQYCSLNPPVLSTVASYASYTWSTGVTTSTATVTEADNPITVTVTTVQGCSGVSAQYIVQELPAFQTNGSITICAGQSVMIHGVSQTDVGDYTGNFQTALGCDSVSVITLTVNPLPFVFAGDDVVVCQGSSIVLNATGANLYTWTGGVSNNVSFAPSVGSATYTVTGTGINGCVNTDEVVVTVNSLPIVNAGNDQSVCAGQSVMLTATGANNYAWSNGVTNGGAFIPSQTATYIVTGTDENGCVNSDNLTIVVNPIPTVFAGNDLTVCEGVSVTLTGSGATTYSWTGGVTNGVPFVPDTGLNSYTVIGTTSNGCTSIDEVSIFADSAPDVNFTIDTNLGCVPLTINLTATGEDLNNCLWSSTSGNWSFDCGSAQMTIIQGGCFDITLSATSSSGCTGSFTANNIVCAEEAPNTSFTVNPGSVSWIDPSVAMVNSTFGASNYEWYFGDNSPMSTQFQPEHTYPLDVADNYTVMLLAFSAFGCVDTAYSNVEVFEDLIFYVPNTFTPDGDTYNQIFRPVFTSGYDPFDYQLLIFNRWGETIFESNDSNVGWDGTYGLGDQVRYVQDGTYTWRIEFKLKRNDSRKIVSGHVNVIR